MPASLPEEHTKSVIDLFFFFRGRNAVDDADSSTSHLSRATLSRDHRDYILLDAIVSFSNVEECCAKGQ